MFITDITDEEIEAVEKTVEEIEQELADKEAEKEKIEQEIADLQAELDEANKNEPKADAERGGKKDMKKRNKEELAEIRSGINKFVHSKGAVREGFTSVEGEALVPEELLTPEKTPEDAVDLRKYVKVIPVNSASGKYPPNQSPPATSFSSGTPSRIPRSPARPPAPISSCWTASCAAPASTAASTSTRCATPVARWRRLRSARVSCSTTPRPCARPR